MKIKATDIIAIFLYVLAMQNTESLKEMIFFTAVIIAWIIAVVIKEFYPQPAKGSVKQRLNFIIKQLEEVMTRQERLEAAIANLNDGTNEIAADLQRLKDELAAGNVSDESLQKLDDNIAILQGLGAQQ